MPYVTAQPLAYPGWRLTIPGGPKGGQYHGFLANYIAGAEIPPWYQYELDREEGIASYDPESASPSNPRGLYRTSSEPPPRANASGDLNTISGDQRERSTGDSVSPGSFPALVSGLLSVVPALGLMVTPIYDGGRFNPYFHEPPQPEVTFDDGPSRFIPDFLPVQLVIQTAKAPPPVSPTPSPVAATLDVVPARDGSGNFIRVSDGSTVPATNVEQNLATGTYRMISPAAAPGLADWLSQKTIFSSLPNWGVIALGVGAFLVLRRLY